MSHLTKIRSGLFPPRYARLRARCGAASTSEPRRFAKRGPSGARGQASCTTLPCLSQTGEGWCTTLFRWRAIPRAAPIRLQCSSEPRRILRANVHSGQERDSCSLQILKDQLRRSRMVCSPVRELRRAPRERAKRLVSRIFASLKETNVGFLSKQVSAVVP